MTTAGNGTPSPPPGPGVAPPFIAPPTDGARQRRWVAVVLAGVAALVCCAGGIFGVGALVVFGTQATVDATRTTVRKYLTAIEEHDYDKAYQLLCPSRRQQVSEPEFIDTARLMNFVSFDVGQPELGTPIIVPATLHYPGGRDEAYRFLLEQDTSTADYTVCGQAR
jgi:hypothetical protein